MGAVEAFGTILIAIVVVAVVAACLSYIGSGDVYRSIGRGPLALDEPSARREPRPGSAAAQAETDAEIRQMLEAKSARRQRRGQPPLDIEAELAELLAPSALDDVDLREEVRQLIVARNHRRVGRGEDPVEVEAEIDRELRELGA